MICKSAQLVIHCLAVRDISFFTNNQLEQFMRNGKSLKGDVMKGNYRLFGSFVRVQLIQIRLVRELEAIAIS